MNELPRSLEAPVAQDVHALLRARRSIRRYRSEPVGPDVLRRVFATVALAPSAHNRQPWRYLAIEDATTKARLAAAMGARLAQDRRRDGDPAPDIAADVQRSFARITGAPVVIVVALTLAEMDAYPDRHRSNAEYLMAVQSTAMATQNLLLAAHGEGLGACWMCAPLFCEDEVRTALSLAADWRVQGLVTLGYPLRPAVPKPRKPLSDFVIFARAPAAESAGR